MSTNMLSGDAAHDAELQSMALAVKAAAIKMLDEREREFLIDMLSSTDVAGTEEADLETLRDAYTENYDAIWLDDDDLASDNARHEADDYYEGYVAGARMVLEHLHTVFGIEPEGESE